MNKELNIKALLIRIPKSIWTFLRNKAHNEERAMNEIINELLEKYKTKCEKDVDK